MKKCLIKTFLLSIIIFALLNTMFNFAYADDVDLDITSNTFLEEFKPGAKDSKTTNALSSPFISTIIQVVNPILGIIQVIGAILSVVSIAIFGFNMILSSSDIASSIYDKTDGTPGTRAKMMEYLKYLIIGSIFLTASVTIVRTVFNIFMG